MKKEEKDQVIELIADYKKISAVNDDIISLYKEEVKVQEKRITTLKDIIENQNKLIDINEQIHDEKMNIAIRSFLIGFLVLVAINIIITIL